MYLLGHLLSDEGTRFAGIVWNWMDTNSYFMWMNQGKTSFFLDNYYSPDEQTGLYVNLLWSSLGRLSAITRIPLDAIYQGSMLLFLLCYRFVILSEDRRSKAYWAYGTLTVLILGFMHAYELAPLCIIIVTYGIIRSATTRTIRTDFLEPLALAVAGLWKFPKLAKENARFYLVMIWVATAIPLVYSHKILQFERRYAQGITIPLGILATIEFFHSEPTDETRIDLLRRYRISLVFWGVAEKLLGNFNPDEAAYLEKTFVNEQVRLYKVRLGRDNGAMVQAP